MASTAGLLYSQAKALLALPHAHVLVQRIIGALAINGGQRFAAQAGETAGAPNMKVCNCLKEGLSLCSMIFQKVVLQLVWKSCCIQHTTGSACAKPDSD